MKKLFVLGIVFGIGLLSQCNKNTEVVKENNDQLDLRTVSCETEDGFVFLQQFFKKVAI